MGVDALALAACGSASGLATTTTATPAVTAPTTTSTSTTTPPAGLTKAQQVVKFLAIVAPYNRAIAKFGASTPNLRTDSQLQAWVAQPVAAIQTCDDALLRAGFTGQAAIDARSMTVAGGVVIGDLQGLTMEASTQELSTLSRDLGTMNGYDNALRADLGLPPATAAPTTTSAAPTTTTAAPTTTTAPAPVKAQTNVVIFSCTGNAPGASFTYGSDSSTYQGPTSVPWSAKLPLNPSANSYDVSAQLNGAGSVACAVTVKWGSHSVSKTGSAAGGYNIAGAGVCSDFSGGWALC